MRDARRRNRNIGTAKSGYGQSNSLTIPSPAQVSREFYERLGSYNKEERVINGRSFIFVVEDVRVDSAHACSIDDIESILQYVPSQDLGELKLIIFRQPRRKEEILSPVWGRLIYSYEFEGSFYPAVVIEAVNYSKRLKWPKKMSLEGQRELERLKSDGHVFTEDKRYYSVDLKPENVRRTQLYRTLLHEIGHYVHYLTVVERPGAENEEYEEWQKRHDSYFKIPSVEKETFAHRYADRLRGELIKRKVIPN